MQITTGQIAALVQGKIIGDANIAISNICKLSEGKPGAISFLANPKYEEFVYESEAAAVLIADSFVAKRAIKAVQIIVADPHAAFVALLEQYAKLIAFSKTGVEEPAYAGSGTTFGDAVYRGAFSYVGQNCSIGHQVKIHPQAYIGDNVKIGDGSIVEAGARILANTVVGRYCVINSGAVIGSPGFGYAPQADGTYKAVPQLGNVILEDFVEIGANTTIDRATMGSTVIETGTKIDNLVQIAHNVRVGAHTVIASQSGVAGSTTLGHHVMIGGQVGFADHLTIAPHSKFGAQTGVGQSIAEENQVWMGSPMMPLKSYMRSVILFNRLDQLNKRIQELEKTHKV